jgi:PIN domain nuclease of toxin-antitoxin system
LDLLLDTHVFLWWDSDLSELGAAARAAISDPMSNVFISSVSIWEIAIKRRIGKLVFAGSPAANIGRNGFLPLPVLPIHAECAADLPLHHRDPFDRMLVAQAQIGGLTLVTADRQMVPYPVAQLWAR